MALGAMKAPTPELEDIPKPYVGKIWVELEYQVFPSAEYPKYPTVPPFVPTATNRVPFQQTSYAAVGN
jgi:hypothetical protein